MSTNPSEPTGQQRTKLDFTRPILAGAAVLFCTLWLLKGCDKPVTSTDDGISWRDTVQMLKTKLIEKDTLISQIQARSASEIKRAKQDSSQRSIENRRLSAGYNRAKNDIEHLRDSLPALNRYVEAADSLLSAKDSLYSAEVRHRMALEELYKSETSALAQKNVIQVQLSEQYATRVDQLTNQNERLSKRLERKKRGNRLLLGVSAGLLTAVGVMALTN